MKVEGVRVQGVRVEGVKVEGVKVEGVKVEGARVEGVRMEEGKGGGLHLTCTCIRNVCTTLVHKYST